MAVAPSPSAAIWALLLCVGVTACSCSKVIEAFPDNYVGIGVELRIGADELPYVVRTIAGGSAREAGLQPGDKLVAIDGQPTRGRSLADVVVAIRGEVGSQLQLELRKSGSNVVEQVIILRRPITLSK